MAAATADAGVRVRIEVARRAGVCFGVERALDLAFKASQEAPQPVRTLGPLIHNPRVVAELGQAGVGLAEEVRADDAGTLIIRAHGVTPQVIDGARAIGLNVVDATCPYVKKVHVAAARLASEGYRVVVVGEAGHPEVEGIMGHAGAGALVVSCPEDLTAAELGRKLGVVVQTTQTHAALAAVVEELLGRVEEVRVVNTICRATSDRQESAAELADRADAMVIVGGKNSGNTRRLAQICAERCPATHLVEDADELDASWFTGAALIGLTAGASTPAAHIEQAVERLRELLPGAFLVAGEHAGEGVHHG